MAEERPVAVVDIDGVVADVRHRLEYVMTRPKDWDAFFAAARHDPPHDEGIFLVRRLARDHDVIFLTGRPDRLRRDTSAWLEQHGIGGHRLVMRPDGDRRPAARVKLELVRELARERSIAVVVDDDPMVLATMKEAGYLTLHADWEARSTGADEALLTAQEVEGQT
jgi:hypothetical protein